jgi:hypothetical protein
MTIVILVSIILAIVILTGIVMFSLARKRAEEGKSVKTSYHALYNFGKFVVPLSVVIMIVFFVLQIPFYAGLPLLALGLLYLAIGWANRAKWH